MMGKTHALSGTLAFAAAGLAFDFGLWSVSVGVWATTGAALWPDIDHRRSTMSNTFGPLSRGLSFLMNALAGGHRAGTHSIAGAAMFGLIAQVCVNLRDLGDFSAAHLTGGLILSGILAMTGAGVIRLFKIPGFWDDLAPIPVALALVFLFPDLKLDLVAPALIVGCLVHIAGDMLTETGCPVFWPVSKKKYAFKLFKTNAWQEKLVVTPVLWVGLASIVVWQSYLILVGK